MSPLDAEREIQRANEAAMVINHPLVVEAINAMRQDAYKKLEATKPSQTAEREFLYQHLKAIQNFEVQFQFHIDNGRMAVDWLDQYRARKQTEARRRR